MGTQSLMKKLKYKKTLALSKTRVNSMATTQAKTPIQKPTKKEISNYPPFKTLIFYRAGNYRKNEAEFYGTKEPT
jgi:hypothetical protein